LEDCFKTILTSPGTSSAYDDALRQVAVAMVAVAARVLGQDGAEDACQEWWLRRFPGLCGRYDGIRPIHPYAFNSLQWWCREIRHSNRKHNLPGLFDDPEDHRQNPLRDERQRELRGMIGRALWKLPKDERQAIFLRYWRGVRFSDAAKRQGCTRNALYVRASKGRAKLKTLLACLANYFRKKRKIFRRGPK
jgi:RNA polymerase sigma factor (sigma-70 family)